VADILGQNLVEALRRFRHQTMHRVFDHAVHAPQIAAELHRHRDIFAMVETLQPNLLMHLVTGVNGMTDDARPRRSRIKPPYSRFFDVSKQAVKGSFENLDRAVLNYIINADIV
jgi:hypothetical protein